MSKVIILPETTQYPISMIGKMAGICWGSDTEDDEKNYKRGLKCLNANHGRTFEYPDVYMKLEGWSARVIREWYTHIGGSPTRLQQSTRYIDCTAFDYVKPQSIYKDERTKKEYEYVMNTIAKSVKFLEDKGVPREDAALLLPLGMTSDVVCKHNLRNLADMSKQRLCGRAYHEYRMLFKSLMSELEDYSPEWQVVVDMLFEPKCMEIGYCPEDKTCGYFEGNRNHLP